MDLDTKLWNGKRVLITGHTGFKGAWLSALIHYFGGEVVGISLPPEKPNSLYTDAQINDLMSKEYFGNICDKSLVERVFSETDFDYVFHLAAQALVRKSVMNPIDTFETNVLGTANLIVSALASKSILGVLVATTDKVYKNNDLRRSFVESDSFGGRDPYSASKASSELILHSLRESCNPGFIPVTSVRAGNVIGGGDWGIDRLVPDIVRACISNSTLEIRNPEATRPWQFILDCLQGYLLVAQTHLLKTTNQHGSFNFGAQDSTSVMEMIHNFELSFGAKIQCSLVSSPIHEQQYLALNTSLAEEALGWRRRYDQIESVNRTANWYAKFNQGTHAYDLILEDFRDFGFRGD